MSKKWEAHMTHSHIPPHSYTWPWDARPGRPDPKKPNLTRPGIAGGPGPGLSFEPERRFEGLVLAYLHFRKEVWPDAPRAFPLMGRA